MSETILVIDDDHRLNAGLRLALEVNGYQVMTASTGQEALILLEQKIPDLIVCDIMMPGMNGLEFIESLHAHTEWTNIPFIFLTALSDQTTNLKGRKLGADDFLSKPISPKVLVEVVRARLARATVLRLNHTLQAYIHAMATVAGIVEVRDGYTAEHIERVGMYAYALARRLGWNATDAEQARIAGILHDIGKIDIPPHILNKAGPLTDEEWEQIKQHPEMGAMLLTALTDFPGIADGVHCHHERYDGTGYPDGLIGDNIPEIARIIAVVDAFDAMTTERPYRAAVTSAQALELLQQNAGTQFDPAMVVIFHDLWRTTLTNEISNLVPDTRHVQPVS